MENKAGILSIQFTPVIGDKKANMQKAWDIMEQYCDKNLDLVVFPEFFSTGLIDDKKFVTTSEDENGGEIVKFMAKAARRFNTNIICGSVLSKENEKIYNTAFVVDRHGKTVAKYSKIHLFDYFGGNEGKYTEAGVQPLVVELDFAKVGVTLCFDIKFPMLYRKLIQMGAEIIVSPSAWSTLLSQQENAKNSFITTWRAMNICRATESLVYFVTSNLVGKTSPYLLSVGNSMIVDPFGAVVQNALMDEGGIFELCDLSVVRDLKGTVPVAHME